MENEMIELGKTYKDGRIGREEMNHKLVPTLLTEPMSEVLRNEYCVYQTEQELYKALLEAAPAVHAELEPWRDKFIGSMADEIEQLRAQNLRLLAEGIKKAADVHPQGEDK